MLSHWLNNIELICLTAILYLSNIGLSAHSQSDKLLLVHISDIHLDLEYETGSPADCSAPPCCRNQSEALKTDEKFGKRAREYGESLCDTPLSLLRSGLAAVGKQHPDVVVLTGDTAPHGSSATQESVLKTLALTAQLFKEFLPGVRVYPVLGNFDFVPSSTDPGPPGNAWLMQGAASLWSKWLPKAAQDSFAFGGFYEASVVPGLRVVAVNTETCHVRNFPAFVDSIGAKEQLAWLQSVLARATATGERCILIGHIAPGLWSGCWAEHSAAYQAIVTEYADAIAAQLFGHQHSGSFRLLYPTQTPLQTPREILPEPPACSGDIPGAECLSRGEKSSDDFFDVLPTAVALVGPSFTPYQGQNPSFRVFHLEGPFWRLSSFRQIWANLSAVKEDEGAEALVWEEGLSPTLDFDMPDLSMGSWSSLLKRMWSDEVLMRRWQRAEANGQDFFWPGNDTISYLCGMRYVAAKSHRACVQEPEDSILRQYVGSEHTYVLTAFYSFHSIMEKFCPVFTGISSIDCVKPKSVWS